MGIYPFEDYQNYSPYIHTPNDLIGNSVNSFEMSQQYCRMNIACLAEIATPKAEHYEATLTFDVDTLWVSHSSTLTIFNNTETEVVTLNKITIDEEYFGYYSFEYDGQSFELNEEVSIDIPRSESVQLEVFENLIGKNMVYPVLYFENTLETVTLVTAIDIASVEEQVNFNAQVFPNPAESQLNIIAEGMQRINVYNSIGQLVESVKAEGQGQHTISVESYPSGVYTLQIVTDERVFNRNVVVK